MSAREGFRRAWIQWFPCPTCGKRSFFPRVGARINSDQRGLTILYRCPSCGGLAQRKRQWLAALHGVGLWVLLAFPLVYWVALQGFNVWTIPLVISVFVLTQTLNVAADWITNDYVPADPREP
jgi:predicted RNA-binding Zn-ribbon protein involved in translation (DUF1610 family)